MGACYLGGLATSPRMQLSAIKWVWDQKYTWAIPGLFNMGAFTIFHQLTVWFHQGVWYGGLTDQQDALL